MRALAHGVDVLVATPGRLLDLMSHRAVQLDRVEVFVLDEADRMLDMGFIHDIRRIVGKLPAKRQTLFFSATMPREITELANSMLKDPVRVAVTPAATTVERIDQRVILVDRAAKPGAAWRNCCAASRSTACWSSPAPSTAPTRSCVRSPSRRSSAEAIHGNKSQNQRERVLAAFRTGKVRTLVATDIAARGIDVEGISHVVNFDLPNIPESYVHRIGRTARAGADGIAISFCDGEERAYPARHREADPHHDPVDRPARRPPCGAATGGAGRPMNGDAAPAPDWTPARIAPRERPRQEAAANRPRQNKPQQRQAGSRPGASRTQHNRSATASRQPQRNGQT